MGYQYLCFMGPPGVGKGTQAKEIARELNLVHISTGDLLREALQKKTPLGIEAQKSMKKGDLVRDDIMVDLVEDVLIRAKKGFILDGFPRTGIQAKALDEMLDKNRKQIEKIILFQLDEESLIERMEGRRMALKSRRIYHIQFFPPKKKGYCDETGEKLIQRDDDKKEIIEMRLKEYFDREKELVEYYSSKGLIEKLDASESKEKMRVKLVNILR